VLYAGYFECSIRKKRKEGINENYPISPLLISFEEQEVEDNG